MYLPLVVLTRGVSEPAGPDGRVFEKERRTDHAAIVRCRVTADSSLRTKSGHHVQLDEPDLVVTSIQELIAAIRKAEPRD